MGMSGRGFATVLALLLCATGPLWAEGTTRPVTEAEAWRWRGVGLLYVGGRNECTAELISPTEMITAGHCVYNRKAHVYFPTAAMKVVLGQLGGIKVALREVRAVAAAPGFTAAGPSSSLETLSADIALLELDAPVTAAEAAPFQVVDWADPIGDFVDIVGYEHPKPDQPMIREGCTAIENTEGVTSVACKVVGGISGAPVLLQRNPLELPQLVAEVSSRARGPDGDLAFVISISPHLAELRALLAQ